MDIQHKFVVEVADAKNGWEYKAKMARCGDVMINKLLLKCEDRVEMTDCIASAIRFAVTEILVNGYLHGNLGISTEDKDNEDKLSNITDSEILDRTVTVLLQIRNAVENTNENKIIITITDQGAGFDVDSLPDPTDEKHLGVYLTRSFMDEVTYNDKGNSVTMVKKWPVPQEAEVEKAG